VYLVDFGSVQTAAHEGTRTIVGTYGYMPPEQFGGQTSPASDLYALGATLIYLATGQPPDQLPQREMRILFADRVNLSPSFINWLKSLTEPSLDLRLRSTKQALAQLGNPDSGESHLTIIPKPDGSRVKITKSSEAFEIFIPPSGFKMWVIPVILFEIGWNAYILAVLIVLIIDSITKLYFGGYLVALAYSPIVLMISYVPTVAVLSTLCFRTRLRITQSEISKRSANGLQTKTLCAAITPQTVVKLHQETSAFPRWKKEERKTGKVSRLIIRLDIFVGSKVISMGVMEGNDALTRSELYWLAQELSSWLNLPIT
jgi:serine/threonine protein kinase